MGKWGWGRHVHGWDSWRKGRVSTDSVEFLAKEDNEEYPWQGALWWKKEKWTVYTWMLFWRIRSDTFMVHISQVIFNIKFTIISDKLQLYVTICSHRSHAHYILIVFYSVNCIPWHPMLRTSIVLNKVNRIYSFQTQLFLHTDKHPE